MTDKTPKQIAKEALKQWAIVYFVGFNPVFMS
jgi:hypothetical protein